MAEQTVLVFCRDFLVPDFHLNLAPLKGEFRFVFASDGPGDVDMDTRADFYAYMKKPSEPSPLSPDVIENIRLRCRLLRNLSLDAAMARIHAMSYAMQRILDRVNPAAVICHMVDEYVIDTLSQLCTFRGIRCIGYCASFFPGRVQITQSSYGQAFDVVAVDDSIVEPILDRLADDRFRQNYIQAPSLRFRDHLRGFLRYQVKRVVFPVKGWLERSPLAVHYEILPYIAEHRRLSDFPSAAMFDRDWRAQLAQARQERDAAAVYIPLSYAPESTNDYWISNTRAVHYEAMILDLIRRTAANHITVVKEHVHMIGCRSRAFYAALRAIPGVINVHPTEFSNLVLTECDLLLLGGGSSGVEAVLRNKPVLTYCETSYWFAGSGATWLDLDDLGALDARIAEATRMHRPLADAEKRQFLRQCLASTVALLGHGKSWPTVVPNDMRAVLQAAIAP